MLAQPLESVSAVLAERPASGNSRSKLKSTRWPAPTGAPSDCTKQKVASPCSSRPESRTPSWSGVMPSKLHWGGPKKVRSVRAVHGMVRTAPASSKVAVAVIAALAGTIGERMNVAASPLRLVAPEYSGPMTAPPAPSRKRPAESVASTVAFCTGIPAASETVNVALVSDVPSAGDRVAEYEMMHEASVTGVELTTMPTHAAELPKR